MWRRCYSINGRLECDLSVESGAMGARLSEEEGCITAPLIYFTHSQDDVQRAVEEETAYLGERRFRETADGQLGSSMLEEVVMDGEYTNLFRRLFKEARAEILALIPDRFLKDTPTGLTPTWVEDQHAGKSRDFNLWLQFSEYTPLQIREALDSLFLSYLVDYIAYRWLENKLPNEAGGYYTRLQDTSKRIRTLLSKRNGGFYRRTPSFP